MSVYFEQVPCDVGSRLSVEEEQLFATQVQEAEEAARLLSSSSLELEDSRKLELEAQSAQGRIAVEKLISSNLGLLGMVAHRHHYRGVLDTDDLFQEGYFGLVRAAEKYRPERGVRFSTYASVFINRCIKDAIAENYEIGYRVPVAVGEAKTTYYKAESTLISELKRMPTSDEIIQAANADPERDKAIRKIGRVVSLASEAPEDASEQRNDLSDRLISQDPSVEDQVLEHAEASRVRYIIDNSGLNDRQRLVLEMRLGFASPDGSVATLEDLSRLLGVTRERIRQIELNALTKIREWLHGSGRGFDNSVPSDKRLYNIVTKAS